MNLVSGQTVCRSWLSSFISELNLSNNRMSTLPEEIVECTRLERVDISHNSFIALPNCLFTLPCLTSLDAKKNFVAGKSPLRHLLDMLKFKEWFSRLRFGFIKLFRNILNFSNLHYYFLIKISKFLSWVNFSSFLYITVIVYPPNT